MSILSSLQSSSASADPVFSPRMNRWGHGFSLRLISGAQQAAGRPGQNGLSVLPGAGQRSRPEEPGSDREPGPGAVREAGAGLGRREEAADPEGGGDEGKGRGGAAAAVGGEGPAGVKTVDSRLRFASFNCVFDMYIHVFVNLPVAVQSNGVIFFSTLSWLQPNKWRQSIVKIRTLHFFSLPSETLSYLSCVREGPPVTSTLLDCVNVCQKSGCRRQLVRKEGWAGRKTFLGRPLLRFSSPQESCESVVHCLDCHFQKNLNKNRSLLAYLRTALVLIWCSLGGKNQKLQSKASSNARCSTYCLAAGLKPVVLTAREDKIVDLFGEENAVVVPCIMPPFRIMLELFSIQNMVLGKQPGMQDQAEWAIQNL